MFVSREWLSAASSSSLWEEHTKNLWSKRSYVPSSIREMKDSRLAYLASIRDSIRTEITKDELCHFTWLFKFRNGHPFFAGVEFGLPRLRRYFHVDHTLTAPKGDPAEVGNPIHTWIFRVLPEQGEYVCTEEEDLARTHSNYVQVSQFPFLRVMRTRSWGWRLENLWVVVDSDHSALPNMGHGEEGYTDHAVICLWEIAGLHAGAHFEEENNEGENN